MSEFRPSPDVHAMADALRSGTAIRRSRFDPASPRPEEARLNELGDLEGLPPLVKPGPAAFAIRGARTLLRVLLRPWLAAQTTFNREVVRLLEGMMIAAREGARRQSHVEQSLRSLEARLTQIEEGDAGVAPASPAAERSAREGGRAVVVDARTLEHLFVHSRLPRPPARLLLLGAASGRLGLELASFGFDVCVVAQDPADGERHRHLRWCRGRSAAIPFRDASFDAVIGTAPAAGEGDACVAPADRPGRQDTPLEAGTALDRASVTEVVRTLKPGGSFIASLPAHRPATSAGIADALAPLRVAEVLLAYSDGRTWQVGHGPGGEGTLSVSAHNVLALVVATRPDAPSR